MGPPTRPIRQSAFGTRQSEQPFLPSQGSKRSHVGQAERAAELVFIAHRAQRETAILEAQPAAIPVVAGLEGRILQEIQVHVETEVGSSAPAALVGIAIAR